MHKRTHLCILLSMSLLLGGCGALVKSATQPVMDNLSLAVKKQQDLETVRQGAPAFLLFMDGLVEGSPQDPDTLAAASSLLTSYAMAFTLADEPERAKLMTSKAKNYAVRAMSVQNSNFAALWDQPAAAFESVPPSIKADDIKYLHTLINAWGAYIRARPGSFSDIADVPKLRGLAQRLLEIDETYAYGAPHVLMGILESLLPPAAGGQPEKAREHFEKAIEISEGKNLLVMVTFAKSYARLMYDEELHNELLTTVINAPVDMVPELTLENALAKQQATLLMIEAADYF